MIIIKKRYVEIDVPEEEDIDILKSEDNIHKSEYIDESKYTKSSDLHLLEKDLQIPLEKLEKDVHSEILIDIGLRLGKMRVQDIAYDLDINIPTVKKYRKDILSRLSEIQKVVIISQEQKIEELREKILTGQMKRRLHNYSFDVESLVRGVIRDLIRQGKSIREIVEQTNLDASTVNYHIEKIKNG